MTSIQRRRFLQSILGAGAFGSLGGLSMLMPGTSQAGNPGFSDFKALVVLYLHGGNDAYNMVVPLAPSGNNSYNTYVASRGTLLAAGNTDLSCRGKNAYNLGAPSDSVRYTNGIYHFTRDAEGSLSLPVCPDDSVSPDSGGEDFGIHGLMPELAQLMRDNKAAAVANVGTLVEPVTKATLNDPGVRLPPFLFAHNHQVRAMETGWADNLQAAGWAGRLADLWSAHESGGINNNSILGLNISYAGATRLMTGSFNSPVVIKAGSQNLFSSNQGFDANTFQQINLADSIDRPLARVIKRKYHDTASLHFLLENDFSNIEDFTTLNYYDKPLFSVPKQEDTGLDKNLVGHLIRELGDVAKMIKLTHDDPMINRLVFFVELPKFDTHSGQGLNHPRLLRELSLGMDSFHKAMEELEISDKVVQMTLSDFGRTLGNNGTGTDHAWAGHNIVVSGAIDGTKRMLGQMPDLRLGGDADTGRKGRLIPDIAIDQYLATILDWFGVSDGDMATLFPNLGNFASEPNEISTAYLEGLLATVA